ncbi:hypothetical protein [Anaeromyxobacter oryzae]|uniref:hypothetical protein n=1 Tax=Anaeromyxobacter oryzae TaxID=2918170 RepID=UPI0020C0C829|nr:hypothetical protein [Anaeromyxobacter oryzae]
MNRQTFATAVVLALTACGNYSTEDLRFLAAVPSRDELQVELPAATATATSAASAVSACAGGTADTWLWAKPTSDHLNATVDVLVGHVDFIRSHEPSWRQADARGWGPFPDARHPGRELRVIMVRTFPAGQDGAPEFAYRVDARVAGSATWTPVLAGTFHGASARSGAGELRLDFDALWSLAMADADAPRGVLVAQYDRTTTPVTVSLVLDRDGYGLQRFGYRFAGYEDRSGAFDYAFRNAAGDLLTVQAGFDAAGGGRAQVAFQAAGGASGGFRQCWDPAACLVYVDDPASYSCGAAPCSFGAMTACPAVPAPPF